MLNNTILDKDPSWMRSASDEELREFLHKFLENMEDSPKYRELKQAFDKECNRRSGEHYENLNNGEWI